MSIYRRLVGVFVALTLIMTACGSDDVSPSADTAPVDDAVETAADPAEEPAGDAAELEVVKLGQVLPFESVLAGLTVPEGFGAEVGIAHANADGPIAGMYKFELVQKDDQLDEARMNTVMRELSDEGVNFTFGFQITSSCHAAAAAAAEDQIVLASHCATANLTDPPIAPNFWRIAATIDDVTYALGLTLAEKYPQIETWDVVGYDYEAGRALWTDTQSTMAEALGRDVPAGQEFWVQIGEQDFGDVVAAQARDLSGDKETRGLILTTYGGGTTAYLQQAEPLGLTDEYAAIAQSGAYWETVIALGERAPRVENSYEYFWSCQSNEANDRFVADYEALAGTKPDTTAYQAYNSVLFYKAAIEAAGSIDPAAVQEAFAGLELPSLTGGTIVMNGDNHQATQPLTVAPLVGDPDSPDGVGIESCTVTDSGDF